MCGPEDIKGIVEAGSHVLSGSSKFIDSLCRIRPGLAIASEARGIASANDVLLDAMEETVRRCRKMGFSESATTGMCMRLANEFSKSENLSSCLSFAQEMVGSDYDASGIDHGWFIRWSDGAAEQTDNEMCVIWGKLLAGELDQPGSYSKRTMSVLADMSAHEASLFANLCSTSIYVKSRGVKTLFAVLADDVLGGDTFNGELLSITDLDDLAAIGLITTSTWTSQWLPGKTSYTLELDDRSAVITNPNEDCKAFVFSHMRYLQEGMELASLCEIGTFNRLKEAIDKVVTRAGLAIEWTDHSR